LLNVSLGTKYSAKLLKLVRINPYSYDGICKYCFNYVGNENFAIRITNKPNTPSPSLLDHCSSRIKIGN
jgi:hypothetical protein